MSNEIKGTVATTVNIKGNLAAVLGKDGASAYEVAVKNGYTGTETEWLVSLKGNKGDNGIDGEDGIGVAKTKINSEGELIITYSNNVSANLGVVVGRDGIDGINGSDGADGKNGTNGKDGYTPQKGVDYFTDEDIAELNIPSVDQTFNPTSENAQSGKAVAEAVATEQKRTNTTFSNALKGSKSGSAILIDDVSPVTHEMGVKVKGKNLITFPYAYGGNTYGVGDTYRHNGVTFTVNADRSITANGTAGKDDIEAAFCFFDAYNTCLANGDNPISVTLSGCPSGGSSKTYFLAQRNHSYMDLGNAVTFKTGKYTSTYAIIIKSGTTVENLVFKPQLELGSTATAYTPYVPDLTAVKVRMCGKNLFDINNNSCYISYLSHTDADIVKNGSINPVFYIDELTIGETYTISYHTETEYNITDGQLLWCLGTLNAEYPKGRFLQSTGNGKNSYDVKITFVAPTEKIFFFGSIAPETISNFQIENGTTFTTYEPYIGAEYTPTADGTVNGVTSLYPNTTLTTDTDGVIINCEYNRDINKAFAALEAAIATNNS